MTRVDDQTVWHAVGVLLVAHRGLAPDDAYTLMRLQADLFGVNITDVAAFVERTGQLPR